jgi:hypothetical protein
VSVSLFLAGKNYKFKKTKKYLSFSIIFHFCFFFFTLGRRLFCGRLSCCGGGRLLQPHETPPSRGRGARHSAGPKWRKFAVTGKVRGGGGRGLSSLPKGEGRPKSRSKRERVPETKKKKIREKDREKKIKTFFLFWPEKIYI